MAAWANHSQRRSLKHPGYALGAFDHVGPIGSVAVRSGALDNQNNDLLLDSRFLPTRTEAIRIRSTNTSTATA